jgi:hypothetical protein
VLVRHLVPLGAREPGTRSVDDDFARLTTALIELLT